MSETGSETAEQPEYRDTHCDVKAISTRDLKCAARGLCAAEYGILAAREFLADYRAEYELAEELEAIEREVEALRAKLVAFDAKLPENRKSR